MASEIARRIVRELERAGLVRPGAGKIVDATAIEMASAVGGRIERLTDELMDQRRVNAQLHLDIGAARRETVRAQELGRQAREAADERRCELDAVCKTLRVRLTSGPNAWARDGDAEAAARRAVERIDALEDELEAHPAAREEHTKLEFEALAEACEQAADALRALVD